MKSIINTKYYASTSIKPMLIALSVIFFFIVADTEAYNYQNEDWHVRSWCKDGIVEYKNDDNTRVDCLTENLAIEFDFAHKYAEAIGQSLHYSLKTGKTAGIVLIMTSPKSEKYYNRSESIIKHFKLPIVLWKMKATYK